MCCASVLSRERIDSMYFLTGESDTHWMPPDHLLRSHTNWTSPDQSWFATTPGTLRSKLVDLCGRQRTMLVSRVSACSRPGGFLDIAAKCIDIDDKRHH